MAQLKVEFTQAEVAQFLQSIGEAPAKIVAFPYVIMSQRAHEVAQQQQAELAAANQPEVEAVEG